MRRSGWITTVLAMVMAVVAAAQLAALATEASEPPSTICIQWTHVADLQFYRHDNTRIDGDARETTVTVTNGSSNGPANEQFFTNADYGMNYGRWRDEQGNLHGNGSSKNTWGFITPWSSTCSETEDPTPTPTPDPTPTPTPDPTPGPTPTPDPTPATQPTYTVTHVRVDGARDSEQAVRDAVKTATGVDSGHHEFELDADATNAEILAETDALSTHSITTGSRYIDADGDVHNFQSGKSTYWLITKSEVNVVEPDPGPDRQNVGTVLTLTGPIPDQLLTKDAAYTSADAFPAAAGVDGTVSYSVANLPTGITMDSTTRKLTGTAAAVLAEASLTYTATDSDTDTATLTLNLSVLLDYDTDDDGLIDIANLAQLNAIRWDLDGNGTASSGNETTYATAFPSALAGMGCPATGCTGYELTGNLDFDTDADGDLDSDDDYWNSGNGFKAMGRFTAILDGNGYTIRNLWVRHSDATHLGLFAVLKGTVRDLGLEEVTISERTGSPDAGGVAGRTESGSLIERVYVAGGNDVRTFENAAAGGIVGRHYGGVITQNYVTDIAVRVQRSGHAFATAGGIAGSCNGATIRDTWSDAEVESIAAAGGLVGSFPIIQSPAKCTIERSYAYGAVSSSTGSNAGGLIGTQNPGSASPTVRDSYWDKEATGVTRSAYVAASFGKTTADLQDPTSSTGIYANWSTDTWDFLHNKHYPVLKVDWDGTTGATWQEFGTQPSIPIFVSPGAIADQALTQGTAYTSTATFPEGSYGNDMLIYSVDNAPNGLSIDSDRKLTGTAAAPLAVTEFNYRVSDSDSKTSNTDTSALTFNMSIAPQKPADFAATAGDTEVTLGWTAIAGVSGWDVKQDTGSWTAITGSGDGTTTHTVTGLTNGTEYTFRVRAHIGAGGTLVTGVESGAESATPLAVPSAPAELTAVRGGELDRTGFGSGTDDLISWYRSRVFVPAQSAVTGWEYRWKPESGSDWESWSDLGSVTNGLSTNPVARMWSLVTGLNDAAVDIEVRAEGATGAGPASSVTLAAAPDPAPPLAAPTGLSATVSDGWTPELSWTAPAGTINGYEYRHRLCPCEGDAGWSAPKALNGYGVWLYLDEAYTPPITKEVLGLPAYVDTSGNARTSEVQLRAVSGIHVRQQRSDYYKGAWSDSVTVSLMGGWYHRTTGTWAVSAAPGYDEVTFGWTLPVVAKDLEGFGDASVQIAWWETAAGVPASKRWLNVTPYGELQATGSKTIKWWTPETEYSYQAAYWIAKRRFVQKDAGGAHTFTTLASPDYPPKPAVDVRIGDAKILMCWTAVEAAPPVSSYEYRFNSLTAGTPKHADEGDWQSAGKSLTSKEITGLTNGSVYAVQFRAVNEVGNSESVWQTVKPVAGAAVPNCS